MGSKYSLFCELFASVLLKIWHIPTPDFKLLRIKDEHIGFVDGKQVIEKDFFAQPCFGSKFLEDSIELSNFMKNFQARGKDIELHSLLSLAFLIFGLQMKIGHLIIQIFWSRFMITKSRFMQLTTK